MDTFCKVFAAYKQFRDSTAFLYQIPGSLLLLSITINFWYPSKVSVLTVSKTLVVLPNGICLTLWQWYSNHTVHPSIPLRVRCISTFFEVRIPNWCVDTSWDGGVAYHFRVTVSLTSSLDFRKSCLAYISYYLRKESQI